MKEEAAEQKQRLHEELESLTENMLNASTVSQKENIFLEQAQKQHKEDLL